MYVFHLYVHIDFEHNGMIPSAIDSESLEPLSVLRSKSKFEW